MKRGTYTRTEEIKKRVSNSLLGKKQSLETKKKRASKLRGQKRSEESRVRMSLAQKGIKRPYMIQRNKLMKGRAPWNKGKTGVYSVETRHKIGLAGVGRLQSIVTRMKKSLALPHGINHYNWKGGITPLYQEIRNHFKSRLWRDDVFKRDNFTCTHCGDNRGGNLNADHIKPFADIIKEEGIKTLEDALKCEKLWDINNGRTLCKKCHQSRNSWDKTYASK